MRIRNKLITPHLRICSSLLKHHLASSRMR